MFSINHLVKPHSCTNVRIYDLLRMYSLMNHPLGIFWLIISSECILVLPHSCTDVRMYDLLRMYSLMNYLL